LNVCYIIDSSWRLWNVDGSRHNYWSFLPVLHVPRTMRTSPELCAQAQNYACMPRTMRACPELCMHAQNYGTSP
jgi:hypothetical protein